MWPYLFLNNEIKNAIENTRKIISIILANGGAPSGHSCPINTIKFNNNNAAKTFRRRFFIYLYCELLLNKVFRLKGIV